MNTNNRSDDTEPFDLESVYDSEIVPLMSQIITICKKHQLPMLASFCYAKGQKDPSDPSHVYYCTTSLPGNHWQPPELREAVHIIYNGASTRPKMLAVTVTTSNPRSQL